MMEFYKRLYGDDKIEVDETCKKVIVPGWLFWMFIHKSGLKSRKRRALKKRVTRELSLAILRGTQNETN